MSNIFNQGWLLSSQKCSSPFFNDRPEILIDMLVIHNISLPCGHFGTPYVSDLFLGCLDCAEHESFSDLIGLQVSPHFFIDRHGCVKQFVATDKRAWHAGVSEFRGRDNINDCSIGIELEGTDVTNYTDEQYHALIELTKNLMKEYPIKSDHIVGHNDVAPGRKTDPGSSFDWKRYISAVEAV